MILSTHETPECGIIQPGFNTWEGDGQHTDFRLIYRSETTRWYFRIRNSSNTVQPRYIFRWD